MMSGGEVQLRCWFRGDLLDHAALRLNVPEVSMISDIATNKKKATSTAEMIRSYASALGVADASEKPSSDEQRKSEGKLVALKRALERFRDDLLSSRGTKKGKEAGIIGRQREKAWHRAARESLGWKEGEAEAALQVARVFSDGTPTMMSLSLVLFAQLYVPRTSASSSSSGPLEPWADVQAANHSPPSSSTSVDAHVSALRTRCNEDAHRLAFLKTNLQGLLELVQIGASFSEANVSSSLSAAAVDFLGRSIFDHGESLARASPKPLSEAMGAAFPVPCSKLAKWLRDRLTVNAKLNPQAVGAELFVSPGNYQHGTCSDSDTSMVISGAVKSTIVKFDERKKDNNPEMIEQRIVVSGCAGCFVYVLRPSRSVFIIGCSDCTIVLGPSATCVTIENCERTTIVAIGQLVRVSNCLDSIVYMHSPSRPIVSGDSRGVRFAPYNASYPGIRDHISLTGFQSSPSDTYARPIDLNPSESEDRVLPPEKFDPIVVPALANTKETDSDAFNPFPLPAIYADALDKRGERVSAIVGEIAELDQDAQKIVHASVQAAFREWLYSSGHSRNIVELLKLSDSLCG